VKRGGAAKKQRNQMAAAAYRAMAYHIACFFMQQAASYAAA